YIEKQQSILDNNSKETQISSADEIKKYKELLDEGIINQEEFDFKKKELLGL
ncbi:TPA: SHOCT domain-containing protein, partial [Enterococcus faecium]|nr:SHOCT domain-containing protein [Enterococcus faecium]HAP9644994.1 SHOCT domain-containing protein [Enterococcus faecium]HAP9722876.1 SHOCT domain-containing protein [Enterococcus faecium]HAP9736400.1 SHOCT domain-containing protein [Enterococcus faecium]HAP9964278.1 SHOCT domain-containing protein [Enterococcus faecium]